MDAVERFGKLVADGSMLALVQVARARGIALTGADADGACAALKVAMTEQLDEMLREIEAALDAHMGEPMYRQIVNVYANSVAISALRRMGRLA